MSPSARGVSPASSFKRAKVDAKPSTHGVFTILSSKVFAGRRCDAYMSDMLRSDESCGLFGAALARGPYLVVSWVGTGYEAKAYRGNIRANPALLA